MDGYCPICTMPYSGVCQNTNHKKTIFVKTDSSGKQYIQHPTFKRVLPELRCPFCKQPMQEFRTREISLQIAYVCDCEGFKNSEAIARNQ